MARKDSLFRLHSRLVARRDALRKALTGDLSHLKALADPGPGGDPADAAVDTAQDEINSQLAELESRELVQIERAMARMRDGTYGLCEGCGCKIPMARLNALLYTTTCIECHREQERTGIDAGTGGEAGWHKLYDHESTDKDVDVDLTDIEFDVSGSGR